MRVAASRVAQLIGVRAVMQAPGLTASEKAVGVAILTFYNEKTGRCDPGVESIRRRASVKRDTVFAAVAKLEALGLIRCASHGGRSHRNAYVPDWPQCEALARRGERGSAFNRRHMGTIRTSPDGDEQTSPNGDDRTSLSGDVQTSPYGDTNDNPDKRRLDLRRKFSDRTPPTSGQAERSGRPGAQRTLIMPLPGGKAASKRDAADGAKQRAQAAAIQRLPADEREAAWLAAIEARASS